MASLRKPALLAFAIAAPFRFALTGSPKFHSIAPPTFQRTSMGTSSTDSCCPAGGLGIKSWLHGRRLLIVAAVGIGGAGLWFGWPWLVVAGIAPVLIALAPCLLMCGAMCAIGACKKKPVGTATAASTTAKTDTELLMQKTAESERGVASSDFGQSSIEPEDRAENRVPA